MQEDHETISNNPKSNMENEKKMTAGIETEATRNSNAAPATGFPVHCSLKCETTIGEVVWQIILWIVLSVVTFGLALALMPYYFIKALLNRTYIVDKEGFKIARLEVEVSFWDILWHILIWFLLSIITFGLAYIVYWHMVLKRLLNSATFTEVHS